MKKHTIIMMLEISVMLLSKSSYYGILKFNYSY